MTDPDDAHDWIEYQNNEIADAKESITDRREHLGDFRQSGLLDGDFVNKTGNEYMKAYLQGYADALDYAAYKIDRIDNLVQYAIDHAKDAEDSHD